MAFRYLQSLFKREPKQFNIYKEYCKAVNPEKRLKENPYYDKYAEKIGNLQKISPENFKQALEENFSPVVKTPTVEEIRNSSGSKESKQDIPRFSAQKGLNQIMKLEALESKSSEEIESIWKQYHQSKEGLYAILPKEAYEEMHFKLKKYPTFLFPLPRDHGYEFFLHQFMEHNCYFTSLINYQTYQENAPVSLKITYFTELAESKGIVLMRGEYDDKTLNVQEAQCLANQLQLYYANRNEKKENLLWTFNNNQDSFRHMDLISNFEYDLIK